MAAGRRSAATLGGPRAGRIAVDPSQIDVPPGEARFSAGKVINYTDYKASGVVSSITAVPSAASGSPAPGV